jgi:hypothetical protein
MSNISIQNTARRWSGPAILYGLLPLIAVAGAVMAMERPVWAAAAAIVSVVGYFLMRRPDVATLLAIFLLYTNSADVAATFHGLPKALAMSSFPVLLLLPLCYYLFIRREPILVMPALPLMLLYLVVQGTSALCARWPDVSLQTVLIFVFEGVALYFLFTNVIRTREMLRKAIWTLLAAGVLIGGVPLFQQATSTIEDNYWGFGQNTSRAFKFDETDTNLRQARLCGPIGEQNRYAQIMLMLVPLGLCRFWSEPTRPRKLLALAAAGVAAGGAAVAFSRGAIVAFALTMLIGAALGYISRKQTLIVLLAGMLGVLAMPQYWHRLASLATITRIVASEDEGLETADGAVRGRATLMAASALVFFDHPVLGVGPGMFKYYSADYGQELGIESQALQRTQQAHVLFVDVAAETGLLGLLLCLSVVALTLRRLAIARRRCRGRDPEMFHMTTGLLLVLIVYLTTGLFLHFAFIRFFWLMMALAASAAWLVEQQAKEDSIPVA